MPKNKLKIGIYELTGCAGDALLIVDCEEELVNIFTAADIEAFLMAKSDNRAGWTSPSSRDRSARKRRKRSSWTSGRGRGRSSPSAAAPSSADTPASASKAGAAITPSRLPQ
jgi:hypothetical protein